MKTKFKLAIVFVLALIASYFLIPICVAIGYIICVLMMALFLYYAFEAIAYKFNLKWWSKNINYKI